MNNEERKELAISKGLIIGEYYYLYRCVLDIYSSTFQKLLNNIIDFKAFDDALGEFDKHDRTGAIGTQCAQTAEIFQQYLRERTYNVEIIKNIQLEL